MKKKVVDKTTKQEKTRNYKKDDWGSSWNPFKRIGSWFMDDYTYTTRTVDGYYDTTEIQQSIDKYLANMDSECSDMEKKFNAILENSKEVVVAMTQRLLDELQHFLTDIKIQEKRIKELSVSIQNINKEIKNYGETQTWLAELKNKIKGE